MKIGIDLGRPEPGITIGLSTGLTAWIETLARSGMCGVKMDGVSTRELISLLVACRAELGSQPVVIDLTAAEYTTGGAS